MYHSFFIQSFVDRHLGFFHVLAIVNSAGMNNGMHVSLSILVSSGYMHRSRIAGSYGGFIPNFLRNLSIDEMDKEAVVHIHNGILLSHKKEHI